MRSWELIDQAIAGTLTGGLSGFTVSYNSDGTIVAIAAPFASPGNPRGSVRVYKLINSTWQQIGLTLNGPAATNFGRGLSLNTDGTIMAVGAPLDGDNQDGSVFVYQFNNAAIYDSLSTGTNAGVLSLARDTNGDLYAGGNFTAAGNNYSFYYNRIAKWNGSSWSPLGDGSSSSGVSDTVYSLIFDGNRNLYAGGEFNFAGGNSANKIAKWNGSSWSPLGSGLSAVVRCLAFDGNGNLYAGGDFTGAGGISANRIAMWNDASWSAVGSGLNESVRCLAFRNGNLYAGGLFTTAGGNSANYIAIWDGSSWSPLGSGLNNVVRCLAFDGNGNLYAGGDFTTAGGNSANRIAKWNGSSWSALGSGLNGAVRTLTFDASGTLFAGGSFTTADGISANYLARWNGTLWSNLGSGTNDSVYASIYNSNGNKLFFGGGFTVAGGYSNVNNITSVNIAPNWEQLGAKITGFYLSNAGKAVCINTSGGNISVAIGYGYSNNLEGQGLVRVFRWNSTTSVWQQLGGNIVGTSANQVLGASLSFNSTGTRLAAGGASGYFASNTSPIVAIFDWNSTTSAWVRVGQIINGPNNSPFSQSNTNTSLSSDGTTVAIGSQLYTLQPGNKQYAGRVQVYTYNGTTWVQRGQNIDGVNAGDLLGISVSLDSSGTTLAVGVPSGEIGSPGSKIGYVSVYQWYSPGSVWQKIGKQNINGTTAGDTFGLCVSLTSDGSRLAIGAPYFNTANYLAFGQTSAFRAIGNKDATTISVASAITKVYTDPSFNLNATSNNDETPIVYSVASSTPANIVTVDPSSGLVTILGAGTATITLSQQQTTNYLAGSNTTTLTILKAPTVITVDSSFNRTYVNPSSTLNLDASTNNTQTPITYSVTASNPANIVSVSTTGVVTITGAGTATIRLQQDASSNYLDGSANTIINVAKASNTITVPSTITKTFGTDVSFNLGATSNNTQTSIVYQVNSSTPGNIVTIDPSGVVTILGAGTVTIESSQQESANYLAATPKTTTITINKAPTVIRVDPSFGTTYVNPSSTLNLNASTNNTQTPITYSVTASNPANIASVSSTGVVTITGAGTATIRLQQDASSNYLDGSANTIINVAKASNTIFVPPSFTRTYGDASFNLDASSNNTQTSIIYESNNTNIVTVDPSGNVTITGGGNTTIKLTQPESANYLPAPEKTTAITINRAPSTITVDSSFNKTYGTDVSFNLGATSTNKQQSIIYTSRNTNVATVGAITGVVTIRGAGIAIIDLNQDGNTNYLSGSATTTINVERASNTITVDPSFSTTYVNPSSTLNLRATSNNKQTSIIYTVIASDPSGIIQQPIPSTGVITITGAGTATIELTQPISDNYFAATPVTTQINIAKATPVISVPSSITTTYVNPSSTLNLVATSTSPAPITYAVTSSTPANIVSVDPSSGLVTITGAGTATITSSQEPTANYTSASATTTIIVNKATPVIDASSSIITTYVNPSSTLNLVATSTNPAPITYTLTSSTPENIVTVGSLSGLVTITGAGTANITISQDETDNYKPGSTTTVITINKATTVIDVSGSIVKNYGDASFNLDASSNSPAPIIYESSSPSVADVSQNGVVTIKSKGTTIIKLSQGFTNNYTTGTAETLITVNQGITVINVDSSFNTVYGTDISFNLNATTNNNDTPITYSSSIRTVATVTTPDQDNPGIIPGIVTIVGAGTPTTAGTTTITLSQLGDANTNYSAGSAQTIVNVAKAPNTITVDASFSTTYVNAMSYLDLGASSTNNQTSIIYNLIESNPVDIIDSISSTGVVTIIGAGTATIELTQPQSDNYLAATPKTTIINIAKASNTIIPAPAFTTSYVDPISYTNLGGRSDNNQTSIIYTVTASDPSGIIQILTDGDPGDIAILGAGTATLTLSQPESLNYLAATSKTTQITIDKISNTITAPNSISPSPTYGDASFDLGATSSNTQTSIIYSVDPSGVVSVDPSGVINIIGAGTATITSSQPESANYLAATPVETEIIVNKVTPVITVPPSSISNKSYGDPSFNLDASSTSPEPISYFVSTSSIDPSAVTVDQTGQVTILTAGTATIELTQDASGNYNSGSATITITINQLSNTIIVDSSFNKTYGDPSFNLGATSNNLDSSIIYESNDISIVDVDTSGNVSILGGGSTTITLTQPATTNYKAATQVETAIYVNQATTVIDVSGSFNTVYGASSFNLGATSNNPAPIRYESSSLSVATVDQSGNVTINGRGSTTITLRQDRNNNYYAGSVQTTINVNQAATVINVDSSFNTVYGTDVSFNLGANTNNTDTPITYSSSNRRVATVTTPNQENPGTVTIVGAGTATITLEQSGDDNTNYSSGSATTTITVDPSSSIITALDSFNTIYGIDTSFNLNASSNNNQTPITYDVSFSDPAGIIQQPIPSSGVVTILAAGTAIITSSQLQSTNYDAGSATTNVNIAKASNTITVPYSTITKIYGEASFNLDASSNNNDTSILYESNNTNIVSVDTSGNVNIIGGGSTTITLRQPESANYEAASPVTTNITVDPSNSIIKVDPSFNTVFGASSFNLGASSNNNQTPIIYDVSFSDPANTVSVDASGNVTIINAGTAIITLTQDASSNFTEASTTTEITVARAASRITVPLSTIDVIYGSPSFNLDASTNNTETPITYFVSSSTVDPSAVTVDQSGNVTIDAIGTAIITLSQDASSNFTAANSVQIKVNVLPIPAIIKEGSVIDKVFNKNIGDPDFNLDASSNSPATIKYSSSTPGIVAVTDDGTVTVLGPGDGIILLQQLPISIYSTGNGQCKIFVTPITTVIEVDSSFNKVVGDTFYLNASTNNLDPDTPIQYIRGSLSLEVDKEGFVMINSIPEGGNANITLEQSENEKYREATTNTIIYVSPIPTVISVESSIDKVYGTDGPFNLGATSNNTQTSITYESNNINIVTVDELGEVTIVGAGTTTITLSQDAFGNYGPGSASTTINVESG